MALLSAYWLQTNFTSFMNTAVDYFGPLTVIIPSRSHKRRVCLFTCLVTKTARFELSNSWHRFIFFLAYRRSIDRRGTPPVQQQVGQFWSGKKRVDKENKKSKLGKYSKYALGKENQATWSSFRRGLGETSDILQSRVEGSTFYSREGTHILWSPHTVEDKHPKSCIS